MFWRKKFIFFSGVLCLALFFTLAIVGTAKAVPLSCSVIASSTCTSINGVVILRMSGSSNAHAALPSQPNVNYDNNVICCNGVFGLSNTCSGAYVTTTVLRLNGVTNAHVQQSGSYSNRACLAVPTGGSVSVHYGVNCIGYDTTLGSMSATDNAHVGNASAYPSNLICASASFPDPVITNMATCPSGGDRDSMCGAGNSPEYTAGNPDGLIYLTGTNFGSAGNIKFTGNFGTISGTIHSSAGGACAAGGWALDGTSVCVEVNSMIADNVYDGTVTLTRSDGRTATIGLHVLPRITSNSPVSGVPGDTIAINGDHFCQAGTCPSSLPDANNFALFGAATSSNLISWTDSQVSVKVPANVQSGTQNTKIQNQSPSLYESQRQAFMVSLVTPATPTNLKQARDSGFTNQIPTGGYASSTPIYFSLDTSDGVSGGMIYPQFEIRPVNNNFVSTCAPGTFCTQGAGVSYTSGNQTLTLSTTTPDALYHWQARAHYVKNSIDYYSAWQAFPIAGNPETTADLIVDTTAPVITTGPNAAPTNTTAVITWLTNELSTSQVQYDKTATPCGSYTFNASCSTSNDCSALDLTQVTSHTVTLNSLTSNGATYCYRVRSRDAANNERISSNFGFATVPVTPATGQITSVIFDTTQSTTILPNYNSIMWLGSWGGSTGRVRFQLSTSNSTGGPWNYFGSSDGGVTCNSSSWYDPGATSTPIEISCAPAYHNNQRYYRYKVQICAKSDCATTGSTSPIVTDVMVNWSP